MIHKQILTANPSKIPAILSNKFIFSLYESIHESDGINNGNGSSNGDEKSEDSVFATKDPSSSSATGKEYEITETDRQFINQIYENSSQGNDSKMLETQLLQSMPTMSSGLIMTLRKAGSIASNRNIDTTEEVDDEEHKLTILGTSLEQVLGSKLEKGKDLLESLLDCGEIRKLDAAIGIALRGGQLDMAFLTVLNMNVNDAYKNADTSKLSSMSSNMGDTENDDDDTGEANRLSILQHIYTRCQEEVEKTVDPGIALLNKLLRTSIDSIRRNQLQHYLGPPKSTITTPDGKEITLITNNKAGKPSSLVSLDQFIDALSNAVQQIRQVENAGGTDRVSAANLVENCRQVAIDARLVIAQEYGKESSELLEFERNLQPIFRPSSTSMKS